MNHEETLDLDKTLSEILITNGRSSDASAKLARGCGEDDTDVHRQTTLCVRVYEENLRVMNKAQKIAHLKQVLV